MKTFARRALFLAVLLAPLSAFAHPGHDGDHDFEWTFSHLAAHPLATFGCFTLIAAGALIAWRIAQWAERGAQKSPRTP